MTAPASPRLGLLVWLAVFAVQAVAVVQQYEPYTFLHRDGAFYATMNRSLLHGTLEQHGFQPASWYERDLGWNHDMDVAWSNLAAGRDGEWWPKHPSLLPLLATPLFVLLRWDGLLLANVLLLTTALWCAWRIARRYSRPEVAALVVVGLATLPVFHRHAYVYSNDVLYTALVLASVERWLAQRFAWSGLLAGLALWSKPTNGVVLLPLGAWLLVTRQWRPALQMAGWAALPLAVHLGMNWWMFGGPFVTSYHRVMTMSGGRPVVSNHLDTFGRPFWPGLRAVVLDAGEGVVGNASIALGGLAGLPLLVRRAPGLTAVILLSLVGYLVVFARFEYTYARFFMPWAALLLTPLAVLVDRALLGWDVVRPGLAARATRLGGARGVALGVAVFAVLAGLAHVWRQPAARWQAAAVVDTAQIERSHGAGTIPCDYFNPQLQKFECAQIEREAWLFWGKADRRQCLFEHGSHGDPGWLWLHPNPGVTKRITFDGLPPGPLRLRYGLAPPSRFPHAQLQVTSGSFNRALSTRSVGEVQELVIPAHERGAAVRIEVPAQPAEWRQLCVALQVD